MWRPIQYIITSGTKTLLSDLTLISFDENNGYYNRINYYLYKDYFAEIDKYSEELKNLTPETDEYKEMEKYTNNNRHIQSQQLSYWVQ